jgi:beta-N-acetylhexosaminidase
MNTVSKSLPGGLTEEGFKGILCCMEKAGDMAKRVGRSVRRLTGWLLLGLLLLSNLTAPLKAQTLEPAQAPQPADDKWLDDTLARMTTADKVGQLFLVTFHGDAVEASSDLARLVQRLRIGGLIVSPSNGNFRNDATAPEQVLSLTTALQQLAFSESSPVTITTTLPITLTVPLEGTPMPSGTEAFTTSTVVTYSEVITLPAQAIPLLIAVTQEGDGYPYAALRSGFTEVPSNMAVGATWSDENAGAVGQIVGRELEAVGINLLLGPSLDVVSDPVPGQGGDLGPRVFGGDPYWVGQLGQAYVRGVHLGSDGHVATVGIHLPGLGASDRSLEEEIATVDKSLEDLRRVELLPFFAVTHGDSITDTTDALMTAHIRYRGFQGNIRYVTPPISLHPQGLQQILAQPELVPWREGGGLLVSDSLGVPAVRRHYSPELDSFPHRQIALDAFLAGNDLLTLSRFSLTDSWEDQMRNIEDTLLFFQARYEADDTFRARVDQSVRRILALKRRICPGFSLEACTSTKDMLANLGNSNGVVAQIAQEAVTLLYPSQEELALRVPRPPRLDEDILIFTDAREIRECDACSPFYVLDPEALEDTILAMYGPDASGQVNPARVQSYTFADLGSFLESGSPNLEPVIRDAEWIVFGMLDYSPTAYPSSGALKQFLRDWTVAVQTQRIVVMAYQAPYYLDTTEVSKLTAYYGLYSKAEPFIDASVRALFLEHVPEGQSPVTVAGVGYDLAKQLSPDPDQVIAVDVADKPLPAGGTPAPIKLEVGDPLRVRTSVILDNNGRPVPDGTPVTFHSYYVQEQLERLVEAVTKDGVAEADITLELAGQIEIRATSDPAINSRSLFVLLGETTQILTPTPTPTPTFTPTPTPTPMPTATPTPTWTPTPIPTITAVAEAQPPPPPQPRVRWFDLVLTLIGTVTAGSVTVATGRKMHLQTRAQHLFPGIALWCGVCSLVGYLYYGLGLPGSSLLDGISPGLRGLLIGLIWGLLPLIPVLWLSRNTKEMRPDDGV